MVAACLVSLAWRTYEVEMVVEEVGLINASVVEAAAAAELTWMAQMA